MRLLKNKICKRLLVILLMGAMTIGELGSVSAYAFTSSENTENTMNLEYEVDADNDVGDNDDSETAGISENGEDSEDNEDVDNEENSEYTDNTENEENSGNTGNEEDIDNTENEEDIENTENVEDIENADDESDKQEESAELEGNESIDSEINSLKGTYGDFEYTYKSGYGYAITGYMGSDKEVLIPATINEEPVYRIENYCFSSNKKIKKVSFEGSNCELGTGVFRYCDYLEEVILPSALTAIPANLFEECDNLSKVTIPSTVTSIGYMAFYKCSKIPSLTIPKGVEKVNDLAFYKSVKELIAEEGMTVLPDYFASRDENLERVVLPSTLEKIGNSAFENCIALTEINIPDSVEAIGERAFDNCAFEEINLPSSLKQIGKMAFSSTNLKSITLADNLNVKEQAFYWCEKLEEVVIGDNVTLGDRTFEWCYGLKRVIIGRNSTLGNYIFSGCKKITYYNIKKCASKRSLTFCHDEVGTKPIMLTGEAGPSCNFEVEMDDEPVMRISGSGDMYNRDDPNMGIFGGLMDVVTVVTIADGITNIGEGDFSNAPNLRSVSIPDSVTSIGENAISGNPNLEYVELGKGVALIKGGALSQNPGLQQVVFLGKAPQIEGNGILNLYNAEVVYPDNEADSFKNSVLKKVSSGKSRSFSDVPKKNIVLVVGTTCNMDDILPYLKPAMKTFVAGLHGRINNAEISIITFDVWAKTLCDFSDDVYLLQHYIDSIQHTPGGYSEYGEALSLTKSTLDNVITDRGAVVFISDDTPDDTNKSKMYSVAKSIRSQYEVYALGLGNAPRSYLQQIVGSPENYFQANYVDELIDVFADILALFEDDAETTAEIMRHRTMRNVLGNSGKPEKFCVNTPELIDLYMTLGSSKGNKPAKVDILANERVVLSNTTGTFKSIPIGSLFEEGDVVSYKIYDKKGKCYDSGSLNIIMTDHFTAYFDTDTTKGTKSFKIDFTNEEDIEEPDIPLGGENKYFDGWYMEDKGTLCGWKFFSDEVKKKRIELEDDVYLKAKWSDTQLSRADMYPFVNGPNAFFYPGETKKTYQISDGDYAYLLSDASIVEYWNLRKTRDRVWAGSCMGMCESVLLMKAGLISIRSFDPQARNVSGAIIKYNYLGNDDVLPLESMINFYQLAYKLKGFSDALGKHFDEDEVLKLLKSSNYPVVMAFSVKNEKNKHAVLGYDLSRTEQTQVGEETKQIVYRVKIYNPNYPGHIFYMDFVMIPGSEEYVDKVVFTPNEAGESLEKDLDQLLTGISYEEIVSEGKILRAPKGYEPAPEDDRLIYKLFAAGITDKSYIMNNYGSFIISDNTGTTTVTYNHETNDIRVDGKVSVEFEELSEFGTYSFVADGLSPGGKYTITPVGTPSEGEEYMTSILYDGRDALGGTLDSPVKASLTIERTGRVYSEYSSSCSMRLAAYSSNITAPWLTTEVYGTSTGLTIDNSNSDNRTRLTSRSSTSVSVQIESKLNTLNNENIPLDSDGLILDSDGNDLIVLKNDGSEYLRETFGYSFIFNSNGGTAISTLRNVLPGSIVEEPEPPVREGYEFRGWFKDADLSEKWLFDVNKVNKDTVIYAGWSQLPGYYCDVRFHSPEKGDVSLSLVSGQKIDLSSCPELDDWGNTWYKDSEQTQLWDFENDVVSGEMTLYAPGTDGQMKVNFWTDDEKTSLYDTVEVKRGEVIALPANYEDPSVSLYPSEEYVFDGWRDSFGKKWDFEKDKVWKNMDLYAVWKDKNKSTVTFCLSAGKVYAFLSEDLAFHADGTVKVENGSKVPKTIENPVKEGYEFLGWSTDIAGKNPWDFDRDIVTKDMNLYAQWKVINSYTVTFMFINPIDDGVGAKQVYKKDKVYEGEKIALPEKPDDVGEARFVCWSKDEYDKIPWNFENDTVSQDVTLYSKWTTQRPFTVTYKLALPGEEAQGGSEYQTVEAFEGDRLEKPVEPKYSDAGLDSKYRFVYWYYLSDGKEYPWNFIEDVVFDVDGIEDDDAAGNHIVLYSKWQEALLDVNNQPLDVLMQISDGPRRAYTGTAIKPKVDVYDNGKLLTEGVDYKLTYKNNTKVYDTQTNIFAAPGKVPSVYVQGIGNYKSGTKQLLTFDIAQRDMNSLSVTLPSQVVAKKKDAKQTIKATVKCQNYTMPASTYKIRYYKDSYLSDSEVEAITSPGTYYIVCEAALDKNGNCTGCLCGKTDPIELTVYAEKPKDTRIALNKKNFVLSYGPQYEKAVTSCEYNFKNQVPTIYSNLTEGVDYKVIYKFGKNEIGKEKIADAGSYTAIITGIGNYKGSVSLGFKIDKFDLKKYHLEGKVFFLFWNKTRGIGYPEDFEFGYSPKGNTPEVRVFLDTLGYGIGDKRLVEGEDYKVSYSNNKKLSTSKSYAYASVTGCGNFKGSIKGTGKPEKIIKSGVDSGLNFKIARRWIDFEDEEGNKNDDFELKITSARSISMDDFWKNFLEFENYYGKMVKIDIYCDGVKLKSSDFSIDYVAMTYPHGNEEEGEWGEAFYVSFDPKGNYSGVPWTYIPNTDMISASDKKNVITLIDAKIPYSSDPEIQKNNIRSRLRITDASGNDISDCFEIIYGENNKVGSSSVTIKGNTEKGYCGERVIKFTIDSKWSNYKFKG